MPKYVDAGPGFGNQLGQALGGLVGGIANKYQQERASKADEQILGQLDNPNLSPTQKIIMAQKLSPTRQKALTEAFLDQYKIQEKGKQDLLLEQEKGKQETNLLNAFSQGPDALAGVQGGQNPSAYANQLSKDSPIEPPDEGSPLNQRPPLPAMTSAAPNQPTPVQLKAQDGMAMGTQGAARPGLSGSQGDVGKREFTDEELTRLSGHKVLGKPAQEALKLREGDRNRTYKETAKLREKIFEDGEEAKKAIPSLRVAIDANEKMKTGAATWDAFVSSIAPQHPFLGNFTSTNAQILQAQQPTLWAGFREQMGGTLTDSKFNALMKKTADVGKSKEANRTILYMNYFQKLLQEKREEIADEMTSEGVTKDFNINLKKRMKPFQDEIDKDLTRLIQGKMPISEMTKVSFESPEEEKGTTLKSLSDIPNPKEGMRVMNDQSGQIYIYQNGKWVKR